MKFAYETTIRAPRAHVTALFQDPENLSKWQDGFVSKTKVSGEAGQKGAVSIMIYTSGKRNLELKETILSNDLPDSFSALYEADPMTNTMTTYFSEPNPGETHFKTVVHYTRFKGFMVKLMATLFPGIFKKQVKKWIDQFKAYSESSYQAGS